MKKFRAFSNYEIKELEVIKETEKRLVFIEYGRECREAKVAEYSSWHDTKEEAMEAMINREKVKIKYHLSQIEYCNEHIKKIKEL